MRFHAIVADMRAGEYQTAMDWFELQLAEETENIELNYLGAPIWQYHAVCLDGLGPSEEAEASFRKGYEVLDGDNAELADYIDLCHEARGEKQKAVEFYQAALKPLKIGYSFDRPYVEEFYEVEKEEFEDRMAEFE